MRPWPGIFPFPLSLDICKYVSRFSRSVLHLKGRLALLFVAAAAALPAAPKISSDRISQVPNLPVRFLPAVPENRSAVYPASLRFALFSPEAQPKRDGGKDGRDLVYCRCRRSARRDVISFARGGL